MSGSDFQRLTDNLACGRPGCPCGRASQNGTGLTHCPAHDDREPSLSCTEKGGKILIHCQAGCPQDRVVEALRERGLWPGYSKNVKGEGGTSIPPKVTATMQPLNLGQGCTLAQYAEAKKLPIGFLKGLGLSNVHLGQPAVRMPYLDRNGVEGAVRFRMALTDGDKFRWKTGAKLCLYGLQRLHEAQKAGYVVLVEGESDCHTLWHHHVPALGIPGADNWREERDADHLDGINTIYVLIEPDKGGETVKKWLAASKVRDRAWLVNPGEYKDPSELHVADPERFLERWSAALEAAVPWAEYAQSAADAQQRQAWALCQGLAREPNILDRFADILPRCGLAGERRAAKLVFLCMVSRFLKRPVSGAVKGPSSVGKSWLVDRVLDFFPSSAFHKLTGMSERALAYSEEPLAHRFLVLYEAAGLGGKFASYLVRSLLSEGRVRYETVEKTKDGLRRSESVV